MVLPQVLRDCARHVGGRLNDLRVHLIGTLRRDQIGNFLHRIDIGAFEIPLANRCKPWITWKSRDRRARSLGLCTEIASQHQKPGVIREIRQCKLADLLRRGLVRDGHRHLTRLADVDIHGVRRNSHRRTDNQPILRHDLAGRIRAEGTRPRIEGPALGTCDLKPSAPCQRKIEWVSCIRQGALNVKITNRSGADSETKLRALWNRIVLTPARYPLQTLGLIDQVRELRARPLERRCVDIGNVVGNDLNIQVLRGHPGRSNCESLHFISSYGHLTDRLIRGHDFIADRDHGLQRSLGAHDGLDHMLNRCLTLQTRDRG